jgi:hypothetical protein
MTLPLSQQLRPDQQPTEHLSLQGGGEQEGGAVLGGQAHPHPHTPSSPSPNQQGFLVPPPPSNHQGWAHKPQGRLPHLQCLRPWGWGVLAGGGGEVQLVHLGLSHLGRPLHRLCLHQRQPQRRRQQLQQRLLRGEHYQLQQVQAKQLVQVLRQVKGQGKARSSLPSTGCLTGASTTTPRRARWRWRATRMRSVQ